MILDLTGILRSDVKYVIHSFPDGENHIELLVEENFFDKLKGKKDFTLQIVCRITSYDDMFILKQLDNIFKTNNIKYNLIITYLLSQRMDRAMSIKRACSLDIILFDLENLFVKNLLIISPHNIKKLLNSKIDFYLNEVYAVGELLENQFKNDNNIIIFPDKGAYDRYSNYFPYNEYENYETTFAEKERDENGNIISYKLNDEDNLDFTNKNVIVLDDLIDGGKTFRELSNLIPSIVKSKTLVVCHAVQEEGLLNTSKYYDTIYISNSYKDWKNMENIIVYSVI